MSQSEAVASGSNGAGLLEGLHARLTAPVMEDDPLEAFLRGNR